MPRMLNSLRRLFGARSLVDEARQRAFARSTMTRPAELSDTLESERQRAPTRPEDRQLSPLAMEWQRRIESHLRVAHLCDAYPRIANRLALCWEDTHLASLALDTYLVDRRDGKRKGFPPAVAAELLHLREYLATRTRDDPVKVVWDTHSQATVDRDRRRR